MQPKTVKTLGLVLIQDVKNNITLANLNDVKEGLFINSYKELKAATDYNK